MTDSPIQLKKCTTCQENLPYDEFSERPNQPQRFKDGFSDICRGCMRWYRRRSYKRSKSPELYSFRESIPLKDDNSSTLDLIVAGSLTSEFLLSGKGVNNELEYSLNLNFLSGNWIATIYEGQLQLRQLHSFPNIGWEGFKDMVGSQLFKLEIKLVTGEKVSTF